MRCAWTFRRFALPLAGVVCWAGLATATELLTPPTPPPDIEVFELTPASDPAPRRVVIETVDQGPVFHQPVLEPPHQVQPVLIHPADPRPIVEPPETQLQPPVQRFHEPPLQAYPEVLPPPIIHGANGEPYFAPSCGSPLDHASSPSADSCYCSCVPNWTIRAEALIWDRVGGQGVPLVTAPVVLSSSDLNSAWSAGPRLTAIRHGVLSTAWDLEVGYFGIDGWSGGRVLADVDSYATTPPIIIGGVTPTTLNYASSLHSVEINLRRNYSDWVQWLVGFRALQVSESLTADFNGVASNSVETINQLFGAQGGVDLRLYDCGVWHLNAIGKAGIYGNSADQSTVTTGVGGAVPLIVANGTQTSFVGELGLNGGYRLTDRFTLLGGYSVMWVTGLALAPNQLGTTNITTGVATLDVGETVFYHGVNVGVEYTW